MCKTTNPNGDPAFWERAEFARRRLQWAHEALHLSQAGFIRLFIDLALDQFMGETKSASTIKVYLQRTE